MIRELVFDSLLENHTNSIDTRVLRSSTRVSILFVSFDRIDFVFDLQHSFVRLSVVYLAFSNGIFLEIEASVYNIDVVANQYVESFLLIFRLVVSIVATDSERIPNCSQCEVKSISRIVVINDNLYLFYRRLFPISRF